MRTCNNYADAKSSNQDYKDNTKECDNKFYSNQGEENENDK